VTGRLAWLNTPADRRVPSSLEPYASALLQEGRGGLPPTGYERGEYRIALKTSALEIIGNAGTNLQQWMARLLWLGARFRRQPLAPEGATLTGKGVDRPARSSRKGCRAMNADMPSRERKRS
jgi:hypothetical protein